MRIDAGGEGVVAHVGLDALGAFTDRLGLGDALSARIPPAGELGMLTPAEFADQWSQTNQPQLSQRVDPINGVPVGPQSR